VSSVSAIYTFALMKWNMPRQPEAIGTVWTVARIQLVGCRVPDCAEAHLLQAIDESGRFEEALQRLATGSGEVRKGRVYTPALLVEGCVWNEVIENDLRTGWQRCNTP
jgi:hypothetical protein